MNFEEQDKFRMIETLEDIFNKTNIDDVWKDLAFQDNNKFLYFPNGQR